MKTPKISQVDMAIIGGGINGAGLAFQAAQAGLSVTLFDKGDFGSGTSSKSTKLIHGGIRYLEQFQFPLVFEALHERHRLLQIAPHLVHRIPFLLPLYKGDSRPPWMLMLGLWLYDFLAGSKNINRHQWLFADEAHQKAPTLKQEDLLGCGLYYDAQVNDARLVFENILAAEQNGALCMNYCEVTQLDKGPDKVRIFYKNFRTKSRGVMEASCLVNASGPWANEISKLLDENALKLIRPTRGSHIVVPEVLGTHAVLVTSRRDNRIIFVIPWRGYSLVGTTDLDDDGNPGKVKPTEEEIKYLIQEASRIFPNYHWSRSKVISSFAGLRTLAWSGAESASSVSREDKILSNGNILTIIGGKLTTYRSMAEKTLRKALKVLKRKSKGNLSYNLPGTPIQPWDIFVKQETAQWVSKYKISQTQANHLANLYGQRAGEVLMLTKKKPGLRQSLHPDRPEILAQVAFAVIKEKAIHLDDVMLRRLEIGYTPQRWGEASQKAARLMGSLLRWSPRVRKAELSEYRKQLFPAP